MTTTAHHAAQALPPAEIIASLPPDGGPEFNRLIFETSPYLRQHARNPVDWYPWGEEAFAKARKENKPVFLSVGYSSCHWCHVMAHESFEDPETAAIMNELFVNIKVDREERPDIDDIYMKAVQAIVGRGGWPMSVFLLPDARPYYGGTYYPREDGRHGPGFKTILRSLADAYHNRHDEVAEQAGRIVAAIEQQTGGARVEAVGPLARNLVDVALEQVLGTFDREHGGSVGAPKFPPHISLALALYEYERAPTDRLKLFITKTLDGMMLGGIHDHIGGGFHRYSTDAVWLLPHFEKMLYDNGQLAHAYVSAYRLFADPHYRAVAEDICDWAIREMRGEVDGFYSALDADSEGEEGKFYVWAHREILDVLGDEDGALFCRVYNVRPDGNFHDEATRQPTGLNIPHLKRPLDELAGVIGMPAAELQTRMAEARLTLRKVRDRRIWPGLDDKVLTSWNGLMIAGLAEAGRVLDRPDYIEAAEGATRFILDTMRTDGRLLRTYNHGRAKLNAYLEDYAFLSLGLLELYEATGNAEWLEEAQNLVETLDEHYWDEVTGGYYFTSDDHEDLLTRQKDALDGATPSGNGIAAQVLVRLAAATGESAYAGQARRSFDAYLGWMQRVPRATESMILAVAEYYDRGLAAGRAPARAEEAGGPSATAADAVWESAQVSARAYASRVVLQAGMRFDVAVRLDIAAGWHLNSHAPLQDYLIATQASVYGDPKFHAGDITYPEGKTVTLGFSDAPLSVYEGTVWLVAPITVSQDAKTGPATVKVDLTLQPCDDTQCLAPTTAHLEIPVTVIATGAVGEPRHQDIFNRP